MNQFTPHPQEDGASANAETGSRADASSREGVSTKGFDPARKHTPGPWKAHCSHIYAPDGAIVATVSNPGSKESDYPLVANRDLMTSAPELLEALEDVAGTTLKAFPALAHQPAFIRAAAAIAKATGQ